VERYGKGFLGFLERLLVLVVLGVLLVQFLLE
jgi:hypothetical protein